MSTGAECYFTEVSPGKWTYWLQDYPYGETEDGQTYGPFPEFARADKDLHDNHANPGGYSTNPLKEGHVHEWDESDYVQVQSGVRIEMTVMGLPGDALVEDVLEVLREGTRRVERARTYPNYINVKGTRCLGCGQSVEGAQLRA